MKRVLLRAPVLTNSGYGVHARQLARWLLNKPGVDVQFQTLPWGDTPWKINENLENGFIGQILKRSIDPAKQPQYDVSFQLQLPNEWHPGLAKYNVGVSAVVETDKCNPAWAQAANKMDKIVVPSTFSKECLMTGGEITKQISVIPESYVDAIDKLEHTNSVTNFDFSTPFNFLIFGQLTGTNPHSDRKNIFFTLKWLCEVFKDNPNVGIVLKTNMGHNTKIDSNIVKKLITGVLSECRKGPFPKVHLLHGDMNDETVATLYKNPKIKAMVSLTKGEGFGLPILEAAASGLPIITTEWSGHMDFMKHGKFIGVYYNLTNVHQSRIDNNIFMEGARWAQPQEEDFKKKIKKFYDNNTIPKQWALDLQSKIKMLYNFETISKMYNEEFKDIL